MTNVPNRDDKHFYDHVSYLYLNYNLYNHEYNLAEDLWEIYEKVFFLQLQFQITLEILKLKIHILLSHSVKVRVKEVKMSYRKNWDWKY